MVESDTKMTLTGRIKPQFEGNGLTILEQRYLLPKPDGTKETPEELVERVSWGREDYYNMIARLDFLPNSPTLFNGGTGRGTLSACFKFDIPDDMEGIMDVAKKAALVLKYGGGVGYVFSHLRPAGSPIKTTHKIASGPVGFMPIYQALAMSITQGGVRQAAQMGILHCDHPDIEAFIDLKSTIEKANNFNTFNISVAATDKWMQENEHLVQRMAENAWVTGDPGLYFIDFSERTNPTPWAGALTGTNPCGEVPLLNDEPCNLGSINLNNFIHEDKTVNWHKLRETVRLAINYLDDTLDNNSFPHKDIDKAARYTRKLGLGVMGWADMLAILNIPYDSAEALGLAEEVSEIIDDEAVNTSLDLGETKGCAPVYSDAPAQSKALPKRNATRTCIAPTGTISILANASSGIEPHFAGEWQRKTYEGIVLHERRIDTGDFVPKTAMEIDWRYHIDHQAAWQQNVDLAVSKTINMPNSVTSSDIRDAYYYAWSKGCKGVTVFRDGSRGGQVLTTGEHEEGAHTYAMHVNVVSEMPSPKLPVQHTRHHLPKTRQSLTHKFSIDSQDIYFTVGLYEDGKPGELFIKASKEGSTISGLLDSVGIAVSLGLQHGVPIDVFIRKYTGVKFEPHGLTDSSDIRSATSILDYIFRWLRQTFNQDGSISVNYINNSVEFIEVTGNFCPECQAMTVMAEACEKCPSCGWSRC